MAAITDLRRLFNLKRLAVLFLINLFVDIISISNVYSLKAAGFDLDKGGAEVYKYMFNRFFCTDISIIYFAMYICLYAFIAFCVVDRIREDNQKFGIFYLTRYSRKKYILGKLSGTVIFTFFVCAFSVFQSFASHRLMKISGPPSQYITVMLLTFILAASVCLISLSVYSVFKSSNIAFLFAVGLFTAQAVLSVNDKISIPTADNIPINYVYPLILTVLGIALFIIVTCKNDFITTKIKE